MLPTKNRHGEQPAFYSEEVEPFAAMVIGRFFAICEQAKDDHEIMRACERFWWAANALNKLATVGDAVHFKLAMSNLMTMVADYIEERTGARPKWLQWKE